MAERIDVGKICEVEAWFSQKSERFGRSAPTNNPKKQTEKPEKISSLSSKLAGVIHLGGDG
jgi:hypothetical protein